MNIRSTLLSSAGALCVLLAAGMGYLASRVFRRN